jgi:hypothetical protein
MRCGVVTPNRKKVAFALAQIVQTRQHKVAGRIRSGFALNDWAVQGEHEWFVILVKCRAIQGEPFERFVLTQCCL